MDNKTDFRLKAKSIRKNLNITLISNEIITNIQNTNLYKIAQNIMIYYPIGNEINLLPILKDNKNFYLPRVNKDELEVCPYKTGDKLVTSEMNIPEPITEPVDKNIIDIVFTPALAIDKNLYRLGYGKGYYDRFFENLKAKKIVIIPEELYFDTIPADLHDKKCDGYITQKKASF